MRFTHSLTVISLGGGVQSSVMALMASQGAFDAIPNCAIFADTHWEPPSLYTHLRLARRASRLPRVRRGQRAESPRGRQDLHQPLRQRQFRRPSRLSEGT